MDWDGIWVGRGRALAVLASLLVLAASACGGSSTPADSTGAGGSGAGGNGDAGASASGGAGGTGGGTTSGDGTGGSGGGLGAAGAGGEAGATDSASTGGAAGASGVSCIPTTPPDTSCEYPESLGGGSDSNTCGVTPGAWFGIGDSSELSTWPERATVTSPNEGIFGSFPEKFGSHQVAFDPTGMPLVLWQEEYPAGEYTLRISRWDGDAWDEVAARDIDQFSETLDLLVDSTGRLLFLETTEAGIELVRLTESAEETLGAWPLEVQGQHTVRIAIDADDRPTILYRNYSAAIDPLTPYRGAGVVQRWTGSTWEDLGPPLTDVHAQPVLALRANGDPVVAYYEIRGNLLLRQWNGSSWTELDGSASGSGLGARPEKGILGTDHEIALEVDAADRVVIAWGRHYRVWNGSEWSPVASVGGLRPRLARNASGTLYLMTASELDDASYLQERLLYRWTDDAWEPLTPTRAEYTEAVDLAIAPDGTVGTAFGYQQVFYRAYAEDAWAVLESPSGAHTGVAFGSHPGVPEVPPVFVASGCMLGQWNGSTWEVIPAPVHAYDCAYARSSEGGAFLAFWTEDGGSEATYLRIARQTDDGWELMGDPELQVTSGESKPPSLAFDSQGRPVVAVSTGDQSYSTRLLRWDGSNWTWWGDSATVPLPNAVGLRLTLTNDDRPVLAMTTEDDLTYARRLVVSEWTGERWRVSDVMTRDQEEQRYFAHELAIDRAGAPVVSWPSQRSLDLARWSGSEWQRLPATDDVLADLATALRTNVTSTSEDVLFRHFEDCAWRGLSASDRDGGVSNDSDRASSLALGVSEDAVCVSWSADEESMSNRLMRCHEW